MPELLLTSVRQVLENVASDLPGINFLNGCLSIKDYPVRREGVTLPGGVDAFYCPGSSTGRHPNNNSVRVSTGMTGAYRQVLLDRTRPENRDTVLPFETSFSV